MKINNLKNAKTTVTLEKDYTYNYYGVDTTITKGTKFDARDVRLEGLVIVLGHGASEVIPHDHLGSYERTTVTVLDGRNDFETIHKVVTEDVTAVYTAFWKNEADKKAVAEARTERINTKNRIATLRKNIEYVKTGAAEKELKLLTDRLKELRILEKELHNPVS